MAKLFVTIMTQWMSILHDQREAAVEDLESSAKMFIYLITCSDDLRSLYTFYKNMFLKSPDLILLTLNRIMKLEGDTSPNKDLNFPPI